MRRHAPWRWLDLLQGWTSYVGEIRGWTVTQCVRRCLAGLKEGSCGFLCCLLLFAFARHTTVEQGQTAIGVRWTRSASVLVSPETVRGRADKGIRNTFTPPRLHVLEQPTRPDASALTLQEVAASSCPSFIRPFAHSFEKMLFGRVGSWGVFPTYARYAESTRSFPL